MKSNDDNKEKISIIVPVYNVIRYLDRCVQSILKQTYRNLEIILVDDGSTDGSAEICDSYADVDSRIKVIHKENGGSTESRNVGLKEATGKYVGFVDSDDWLEPEMYDVLYEAIIKEGADVSVGRFYINHDEDDSYIEAQRSLYSGTFHKSDGVISHNIIYSDNYDRKGISPNLWDKLFLRERLKQSQFIVDTQTRYAEDDLCIYDYMLHADCVTFVNRPLYHYYQRNGSITKSGDKQYFEKISLFYNQAKEIFEKHEERDLLMQKLDRYMLEFVLRGINTSFGFNYGNLVPFYRPEIKYLREKNIRKIVLYGAGNVGRDFYYYLKQLDIFSIVAWLDRNYEKYNKLGMDVRSPEELSKDFDYDVILIAVDSDELASKIKKSLIENLHVKGNKIFYKKPKTIVEEIEYNE